MRTAILSLVCAIAGAAPASAQRAPAMPPPSDIVVAGRTGAVADSVLRAAELEGFSGVALVAHEGEVLLQKGYGLADREARTPMTPAAVVQIGSNTKDFTALAILQLIQAGRIGPDDPITRFFPEVPVDKRGITVWQLLTHRAGLIGNLGADFEPVIRDSMLARLMRTPLRSVPGVEMFYSNAGYAALAAIVEIVSGQPYEAYVRDYITTPLGLQDTGYLLPGFDARRLARGYQGEEPQPTMLERPHLPDGHAWHLRGAGGLLSTVHDMYRFYRALSEDGRLISAAVRDRYDPFVPGTPKMLAGSDLVNFFLFNEEPQAGYTILLASTSTAVPAPDVHRRLLEALGVGGPGGAAIEIDTGDGPRPGVRAGRVAAGPASPIALPETPAGRAAATYFSRFNSGTPETMRAFFRDEMAPLDRPLDARVERYAEMFGNLGALTPVAVNESAPTRLSLRVATAKAGEVTVVLETEMAPPHRLVSVMVLR